MLTDLLTHISLTIDNFRSQCNIPKTSKFDTFKAEISNLVQSFWSQNKSPPKYLKRLNILTKIRSLLKNKLYHLENDTLLAKSWKNISQEEVKIHIRKVENEIQKLGISTYTEPMKLDDFNASLYTVSVTEPSLNNIDLLKSAR